MKAEHEDSEVVSMIGGLDETAADEMTTKP
jgi:hypothetical protein